LEVKLNVFVDLFSGIGGFALAAQWAGLRFNKHFFSEIETYPISVYQKRFPNAVPLGDIKHIDGRSLCKQWRNEEPARVIMTGGFP
jgi:site-specific DNA-cytosine methylase